MAYVYQVAGQNGLDRTDGRSFAGMEQASREVGRQITRLIRSWNDPGIAFYLVTGGGAIPLFEQILPGEAAKILATEPQGANGRGYFKAGVQRWGAGG